MASNNDHPYTSFSLDFQCSIGYPVLASSDHTGRGTRSNTVTQLIPDLNFTCDGIITQFTIGGLVIPDGTQDPKIQIWRECPNQSGVYFKPVPDIPADVSVCMGGVKPLAVGLYECTLNGAFRVQVQAGDILGLELPPTDDQDFEVYFTSGGPINYVFQGQIVSAAELANRDGEVEEQPQINVTILSPPGMTKSLKFYSIVC